ncbi:MAG: hypothetical protein AAF684_02905 [Pseudomonadota bacterium]
MRFAILLLAGLTTACAGPLNPFAPDPEQAPDFTRFVILAPDDRQSTALTLCARLRDEFAMGCEAVASEGVRVDVARMTATPGFLAFVSPEAIAAVDAAAPIRAVLDRPFMLFARRARGYRSDADLAGLRIGATPDTLVDFEVLMAAQDRADADFEALYEIGENDIRDFAELCDDDTDDAMPFDVLAATAGHPDEALRAMADDKDCRIRPLPLSPETVGAVIAQRSDRAPIFVADQTLDAYRFRGARYPSFAETVDLAIRAQTAPAVVARIRAALGARPNRLAQ